MEVTQRAAIQYQSSPTIGFQKNGPMQLIEMAPAIPVQKKLVSGSSDLEASRVST